ncbi:hypothetical protein TrVE_jg9474 [Triparma verrucosa]|uniref:Uncharacterized protein n=1 Tax=Triparma verrucosa TaxID=1606542 RepID=A0A9W7F5F0_9STRA|nr:hypothetical protein TrVE_jg9474 [Triparma verrucosa]
MFYFKKKALKNKGLLTGAETRDEITKQSSGDSVEGRKKRKLSLPLVNKKAKGKGQLLNGAERRDSLSVSPSSKQSPKDSALKYGKNNLSEVMFGHDNNHLAQVNLEDDAFADWYRKTAGMHTVETWLSNYKRHPYAWGALIMIHGVDEVSARLRSKVENYAVYSAVLLSASIVMLIMPEINKYFLEAHWVLQRIFLYSMCISVASHLCSILLSMAFVNALNEAGRDSDVIRMFGEGQGFLATDKCSKAFSTGIFSLAIGILDMVLINFTIWDMLACLMVGGSIMYKVIPTAEKLFSSSSLVSYWRWGVGKDGEIGSRALENEDPFDLRVPMERVMAKARISERLYDILQGNLTLDNYEEYDVALRKKDDDADKERDKVDDGSSKVRGSVEKEEVLSVVGEEVEEIVEVKVVQKSARIPAKKYEAPAVNFDDKKSPLRAKWRKSSISKSKSVPSGAGEEENVRPNDGSNLPV